MNVDPSYITFSNANDAQHTTSIGSNLANSILSLHGRQTGGLSNVRATRKKQVTNYRDACLLRRATLAKTRSSFNDAPRHGEALSATLKAETTQVRVVQRAC